MSRSARASPPFRLRHEEAAEFLRLGHRRRKPDHLQPGRERVQPRQPQRQQIAALGRHQRMQLVEHHALERAEQKRRVGRRQQQRQLLRRREQDVGRVLALAHALGHGRVAGARLDADRELHLRHRLFQVAGDVDGERLERRDVERVQPARAAHLAAGGDELGRALAALEEVDQRRQEARERLAAAGGRDEERRLPGARAGEQLELVRVRFPAPPREPFGEAFRQRGADGCPRGDR